MIQRPSQPSFTFFVSTNHHFPFVISRRLFYDNLALTKPDDDAQGEARFVTVGVDALGRILAVYWTERDHAIRLISARLATTYERKFYEN